ncbi:MAG: hypothetical protein JNM03_10545 [Sphingopyxis sp.]|uniref:hypothetical protein n=1 Tax=Sphingopyxis sp. TaxID=1908224 RepID=UPI001A6395E5|nr:hypothetical protein [Sphingopyxis sp.]MBL9070416.1 hypothetical protein [Sphingopyxis sp.]
METTKRKVASAFIQFVPDHGIVVGNDGESVEVPLHLTEEWEGLGYIKKKGEASKTASDGKADDAAKEAASKEPAPAAEDKAP